MATNYTKIHKGLTLKPKAASTNSAMGDLEVDSGNGKLGYHNGTSSSPQVTEAHAATLTNKTIDSDLNTISNLVNANIKAGAAIAYSKLALTNSIVNADVATGAAIAYAKLALTGSLVNADVSASAAIAYSKLNLTGTLVNADVSASAAIAYSKLALTGSILNADISAVAAIAYSKLSLSNSIVNADIATGAAIAYSKLALSNSIVNADIASGAAIAISKIATGLTGSLVGTTDTQTLTNKTLGDALTLTQIATPSTPSAGLQKIYAKTDGYLYGLDSNGVERQIGTNSGSGNINYVSNSDFESNATGYNTYADAAGVLPVDGTGGSPTVTLVRSTSSPLRGAASGLFTKGAANTQGQGFSFDFTIDSEDAGKTLLIDVDYLASTNYVAGDMIVYIYDKTNSTLIQPSSYQIPKTINPSTMRALFQTSLTSVSYRLIFHVATTSALAYTLKVDRVNVGPSPFLGVDPGAITTQVQSTTNLSVTGSSPVIFPTVNYDTKGAYNPVTGIYTCPTAGVYDINASGLNCNTNNVYLTVFKNGAFAQFLHNSGATNASTQISSGGASVRCNAGDQLTVVPSASATYFITTALYFPTLTIQCSSSTNSLTQSAADVNVTRYTTAISQSIPNATATVINYDTKDFDTAGSVTTGASWKYTANAAGFYKVTGSCQLATLDYNSGTYFELALYKNGTRFSVLNRYIDWAASITTTPAINGSSTVQLNAGDYIDIRLIQNNGANISLNNDSTYNFCNIEKLSASATVTGVLPSSDYILTSSTTGGYGSSATTTRYIGGTSVNSGNSVTYTPNTTLGDTWTINAAGLYCVTYIDFITNTNNSMGITHNSAQLSTNINAITNRASVMALEFVQGYTITLSSTRYMNVGDVVRIQGPGGATSTSGTYLRIDRIL